MKSVFRIRDILVQIWIQEAQKNTDPDPEHWFKQEVDSWLRSPLLKNKDLDAYRYCLYYKE